MEITISPTENPHETSPTALGPGIAHADGILDASQLWGGDHLKSAGKKGGNPWKKLGKLVKHG